MPQIPIDKQLSEEATILVAYVVFVLLLISAGIGLRHFSHAHELGMADITCENVLYAGKRE